MMLAFLLAAALTFLPDDARFARSFADSFVSACTPRDAGTIRGRIAANYILDETSKLGADVRRDVFTAVTPKGPRQFTNLFCEFPSSTSTNWVVLVSHFDTKPGTACPGANDGASTTALLVSLVNVLGRADHLGANVMLLWTDGEESMVQYGDTDGFWGSKRMAHRLKNEGRAVRAVICADMLGDEDLHISVPANGSATLAKIAEKAAERIGCAGLVRSIPEFVKDDHVAFIDCGFRAIDLIDFSYGPDNAYWHTAQDTMAHVSEESLLKSGRLLVELLNILMR